MTSPATSFERFDRILGRTDAPTPEEPRFGRELHAWNSWESWLTFALVIFVQLPVVGSLQSANWVNEMPSLMAPAATGLVLAWVLGYTRLSGVTAALIATATGAILVIGLVLHTMVLVDPTHDGLVDRWWEFRFRLLEWGRAFIELGISTDPLPFVVMMIALVFTVAFVSTWAVVRWRSPWIALIPGGFVLLTNISYLPGQPSFSFVLFLVAAILLVARLTFLQSLTVWRSQGVAPREGMSVEVILVAAAVAFGLVFAAWTIPTANNWGPISDAWGHAFAPVQERVDSLGRLFVGVGSKKPLPIHSMDAVLPLQGRISLDEDVIFEVVAPGELNLRGAVYDEYTGAGWRVSSASALPLVGTTVEAAQLGTPSSRAQVREAVRIDVTVMDPSAPASALLSIGDPIASDRDATLVIDDAGGPLQLRPEERPRPDDSYSTVGTRSVAAVDTLQEAGSLYPASIAERYLELPDNLPQEVDELTRAITADAANPYDAARLVELHLRENYGFAFDISPPPPGSDAVAHFLFESKQGYFDIFASSMAVMLRTVGIPTRVAVGFALDDADYDRTTKAYSVTEERAWTWPEVYFPGLGWVEFNPTPSRDLLVRPGDDSAARAAAQDALDDTFASDDELFAGFSGEDLGEFQTPETIAAEEESALQQWAARIIGWTLVLATIVLIAGIAVRLLWERIFRGLSPAARRWAKMQWFSTIAGLQPAPDRTPAEVAEDLASRLGEADALRALARAYTRSRYGGPDAGEESEDQATDQDTHYRRVRRVLLRLILRRITRVGRVYGGPLSRGRTPAGAAR